MWERDSTPYNLALDFWLQPKLLKSIQLPEIMKATISFPAKALSKRLHAMVQGNGDMYTGAGLSKCQVCEQDIFK